MHVVLIGLSHKTAPLPVREAAAVSGEDAPALLGALVSLPVREAAVLSTCNRTEFYLAADSRLAAERAGVCAFERLCGDAVIRHALYVKEDAEAARHLFSVAAGLDSLVLGESQVLGQVRQAYETARQANTAGPYLSQLFNQAVRAGKRVRSETGIGGGAASVSYAAVELAKRALGDLRGKCVLLVGAGKMAELAAKNLAGQGAGSILVANRSPERAARVARLVGGEAHDLGALRRLLTAVDIVIASTGAGGALLSQSDVAAAMEARRGRPLFVIDIAVPRDVEESAGGLPGVFLYNIDDLRGVVDKNLDERRRHIAAAERIVAEEAERYGAWMDERRVAPVIRALSRKVHETAQREVARVLRRLDHLSDKEKEAIRSLAGAIAGKLLYGPTLKLKESARGARADFVDLVGELFSLELEWDAKTADEPAHKVKSQAPRRGPVAAGAPESLRRPRAEPSGG